MTAAPVPVANLFSMWPKLWPLLEPAYKRSSEKADLLAGIIGRNFQLWSVNEAGTNSPVAGIVSKLLLEGTSGELHCHLWLVGGSRMSLWAGHFIEALKPWARSEGACAITGNGRKGWERLVGRFGGRRIADREGLPCWRMDL